MSERVFLTPREYGREQRRQVAQRGASVSPQETSIPEELLVTVVKPGLPTLADLHVLLPPPRPTRKRSPTSDKVSLRPWVPGSLCTAQSLRPSAGGLGEKSQRLIITERPISRKSLPDTGGWPSSMGPRWTSRSLLGTGEAQGHPGPDCPTGGLAPSPFPFCWLVLVTTAQADRENHGLPWRGSQDRAELSLHQVCTHLHCMSQL